jgi:hypothetical protein
MFAYEDMFQPERAIPSAVYLGAMVLTLVAALKWQITIVTLVAVGIQIVAAFWYGISCIFTTASSVALLFFFSFFFFFFFLVFSYFFFFFYFFLNFLCTFA